MKNIFVGNLSFGTTEDEIRHLFEKYGAVERVKIVVGLAWPSKWLMVERSTPDFSSATAVLCRTLWGCKRFLRRFGRRSQARPRHLVRM